MKNWKLVPYREYLNTVEKLLDKTMASHRMILAKSAYKKRTNTETHQRILFSGSGISTI
jgi:hypothetical protein